jgi:hypothetical protein
MNVAGPPTTWGMPETRDPGREDGVPVARLKAADAVVLDEANVSSPLIDWQSHNFVCGPTSQANACGAKPHALHRCLGGLICAMMQRSRLAARLATVGPRRIFPITQAFVVPRHRATGHRLLVT